MEIELVGRPVVREENGLALSSRNKRLSEKEKQRATAIYRALSGIREDLGFLPKPALLKRAAEEMEAAGMRVEYVEIVDGKTLEILDETHMDSGGICAGVSAGRSEERRVG